MKSITRDFFGIPLTIEAGRVAKQADGGVLLQYGDTVVLVAATSQKDQKESLDFFPLTVEYREKLYAAGRIPGGFFKREGRPTDKETLTARLIDRPIRPLFPKAFHNETQVVATVLSVDSEHDPDLLAITGASAALLLSEIPWNGPIGGVRVGRIEGELICNPTRSEMAYSDIDIIVAGTREGIVMVEGSSDKVAHEVLLEAILFGHSCLQPLLEMQEALRAEIGKIKREIPSSEISLELIKEVQKCCNTNLKSVMEIRTKIERQKHFESAKNKILDALKERFPDQESKILVLIEEEWSALLRSSIVKEKRRVDGRTVDEIRPISCEVGLLPRTHGSALFTRGETQALVVTTLGTANDEQKIEGLEEFSKSFMLHYNFPSYSVGEVKPVRSPGRREIGHGALAERALSAILPESDAFPYTIRIVSDILESNGSSSMATVCGGTLSLMDAGVPIKAPVAGIAMGLIKTEDDVIILSDILGDEDHIGDMDFKIAGSEDGLTAIQMDIKILGVTREILKKALNQAVEGLHKILDIMIEILPSPREDLSIYAPRIITIKIKPERIKDVIGPGGKAIRKITEETGAKIEVEDDGHIEIAAINEESLKQAIKMIRELTEEAEIGKSYNGKVKRITEFGAFVEILPGTEGLIHISHLAKERVRRVSDVLREGDEVFVKVIDIDQQGKIRLSRKAVLDDTEQPGKTSSMIKGGL